MTRRAPERRVLDDAGGVRVMTGVLAVLLFLTVLATALGLATIHARVQLTRQLAGRMTVQLLDDGAGNARAVALLARLRAVPGVTSAIPVDRAALTRMLRPWLGGDAADPDLPVPTLIDVDLTAGDTGAAARVEKMVQRFPGEARADRHAEWMSPVLRIMISVTALAGALMLLTVAATAAVVLLAVRAGLETHRATIEVMHMLGSTDVQIARLFQRRIARDAALGGLAGAIAALAVAVILGSQLAALGSDLLGSVSLDALDWLSLACLPAFFLGFAVVVARVTVLASLRRTL